MAVKTLNNLDSTYMYVVGRCAGIQVSQDRIFIGHVCIANTVLCMGISLPAVMSHFPIYNAFFLNKNLVPEMFVSHNFRLLGILPPQRDYYFDKALFTGT